MNRRALAAFAAIVILVATASLIDTKIVFADGYEQNQAISQVNDCGNYWFPLNVFCSKINSQIQGDENNVAIATPAPEPDTNYGAPFP